MKAIAITLNRRRASATPFARAASGFDEGRANAQWERRGAGAPRLLHFPITAAYGCVGAG